MYDAELHGRMSVSLYNMTYKGLMLSTTKTFPAASQRDSTRT